MEKWTIEKYAKKMLARGHSQRKVDMLLAEFPAFHKAMIKHWSKVLPEETIKHFGDLIE